MRAYDLFMMFVLGMVIGAIIFCFYGLYQLKGNCGHVKSKAFCEVVK